MKQTAVEWLVEKLENEATLDYSHSQAHKIITLDVHTFNSLIQQVKAMEKEQIEDAWYAGDEDGAIHEFEYYYNETYNK